MPFRYTGREKDSEAIYYYRARYYNTETKQFLSRDPSDLLGGVNPYAFVDANPISNVDPSGLHWRDKTFGLPKKFWNWYHKDKQRGDPDLCKEEAEEMYQEWIRQGRPGPDSRGGRPGEEGFITPEGLFMLFIPFRLLLPLQILFHSTELACAEVDCDHNGVPDFEEP